LGDFVGIGEVEGFEAVGAGFVTVGDGPVVAIGGDDFVHIVLRDFDIHLGVEFACALFVSAEMVGIGDVLGSHFEDEGVKFLGELFSDGFELLRLPIARAHDANETVMRLDNGILTGPIGIIERVLDGEVFLKLIFPDGFAGVGDVGVVSVFDEKHDAIVFGEVLRRALGGLFAGVTDGAGEVGEGLESARPSGASAIEAVAENEESKKDDADSGEAVFAFFCSGLRGGSGRMGRSVRTRWWRRSGRGSDGQGWGRRGSRSRGGARDGGGDRDRRADGDGSDRDWRWRGSVLAEVIVGEGGAVSAAGRATDGSGHAAVDGLDVEFVFRAARALDFDFHCRDWVAGSILARGLKQRGEKLKIEN